MIQAASRVMLRSKAMTKANSNECSDCGKSFSTAASLQRHKMSVHEEKSYMCDDCGKTFARPEALKSHSLKHSEDKPYKCDVCGKSFTLLRTLDQHRLNHVEENSRLDNCAESSTKPVRSRKPRVNWGTGKPHKYGKKFTRLQNLEKHKVLQSGDNLHGSDESENEKIQGASESDSEVFSSEDDTESKPIASFPYKCCDCVRSFSTEKSLKMHRFSHSKTSFKCSDCGKLLSTLKSLRSHRLVHNSNRPYECDKCDKSFTSSLHLKLHGRIHSGKKPHKCGDCGKSFRTSYCLNRHQRHHVTDKPYKCDECGKSFTMPYTLEVHKLFHSGHKPHKCDECGKSYTLAIQLKNHQLSIHRNEKRFKCSKCSYATFFKNNLKIHFQGHKEKTFACDKCGKMYARLNGLKRHRYIHNGKLYKCYECSRSFYVSEKLRQHVLRVHKKSRRLQCSICDFVTYFKKQLKSHLIHHVQEESKKSDTFDKPFNKTAGSLKQNKQSGRGNNFFECDNCGQLYTRLLDLKLHRIILCSGLLDVQNTDEVKPEVLDSDLKFQYHYGTKAEENEGDLTESCSDLCSSQSNQGDELAQEEQLLQTSKGNPNVTVSDEPLNPDHNLETDEACPSEDPDFDWDLLHHPSPTNFSAASTGKVQQLAAALLTMVPTLTSRDQQEAEFALSMAVNYPDMADRERNVLYQRLNLLYLAAYHGWPHTVSSSFAQQQQTEDNL